MSHFCRGAGSVLCCRLDVQGIYTASDAIARPRSSSLHCHVATLAHCYSILFSNYVEVCFRKVSWLSADSVYSTLIRGAAYVAFSDERGLLVVFTPKVRKLFLLESVAHRLKAKTQGFQMVPKLSRNIKLTEKYDPPNLPKKHLCTSRDQGTTGTP